MAPDMSPTIVNIPRLGSVQGLVKDGVASFRNVPFGTIAERWRHATSAPQWSGVRDGTAQGPICPQLQRDSSPFQMPAGATPAQPPKIDELECLNMNIFGPVSLIAPVDDNDTNGRQQQETKVPVMVFVHGGSLRTGSNGLSIYDASNLVKRSIELNDPVVVVIMNYRLHYLGFLSSSELIAEDRESANLGAVGNWGLTDQKLGFEWVRSHIGAFGGNHQDVTAFGESAGARSLGYHLIIPSHFGLFDKAIVQSGSNANSLKGSSSAEAENGSGQYYFDYLCKNLLTEEQNKNLSGSEKVKALRLVSTEEIGKALESSKPNPDSKIEGWRFSPTFDGSLVTEKVRASSPLNPEIYNPNVVRVMTGTCKDEGTLFAASYGGSNVEQFAVLKSGLVGNGNDQNSKDRQELFDKIYGVPQTDEEALLISAKVVGDGVFQFPTLATAKAIFGQQEQQQTIVKSDLVSKYWPRVTTFQWNREIALIARRYPAWGAHHAVDLMYVFGADTIMKYLNPLEKKLSKQTQEVWIRFATGNAVTDTEVGIASEMGDSKELNSIVFGGDCSISTSLTQNLSEETVGFWTNVLDYVQTEIDAGNPEVGYPNFPPKV